ncbi:prepilin-type N-terminal cleavage/methylation domain-containing protein [bacterium]|nr:prepilin-type N-terminal cleavage/methylation domain-containing protein [bacterium]
MDTRRCAAGRADRFAFTLVELLICVAILAILAAIALPHFQRAQVQAKISASRNNQRTLAGAIEIYLVDYGRYPEPVASEDDRYGIVSHLALKSLTTPIAYIGVDSFHDPFGLLQINEPVTQGAGAGEGALHGDPFRLPSPSYNTKQSLFYFYYPHIAEIIGDARMYSPAYAIVSVGPDLKDSFMVYFPFPESLPQAARQYGICSTWDCVYDPTNGTRSEGDFALFGGRLSVPRFVGGGS